MTLGAASLLATGAAQADDFIVYSPYVMATQTEIELRGYRYDDARANFKDSNAAELSIARAPIDWWKPEVYVAKYERAPGSAGRLIGYEFENTFQLTQQGEYWADVGFLVSYEHMTVAGAPDAIEFGPLIAKTTQRFAQTFNVIWEKQVGSGASRKDTVRYSYLGTYAVSAALRPGLETYVRPNDHAYQAGPIVAGEWHIPGTTSNLGYRLGALAGINAAAPRRTWLARVEYEFF